MAENPSNADEQRNHHDEVLAAALDYLDRGFSVVPQRAGDKKPCVRWKPFQERLPTREEVIDWLKRQFPDAGLAVVLGPVSNLFVIDVDGPEAHAELVARLGSEPVSPKVLSGSGKPSRYHLFFRHPPVATRAKLTPWHPHLEFRGNKGIVILPPSLHKSGKQYQWAPGRSLDDLDLPDVPPQVLEALTERAARDAGQQQEAAGPVVAPSELSGVQSRARAYLAKLPPAVEGQGGDKQTFTAACVLVIDFGLSPTDALPLLREYNERCRPPWTEAELLHKLQEADRRPGPRGKLLDGAQGQTRSVEQQPAASSNDRFLMNVPDFVLADWYLGGPRMVTHDDAGRPLLGRSRIIGGLRWAIHLAVVFQRSSVVVLPDVMLGQVVWGGARTEWPKNWRGFVLEELSSFCGPGKLLLEVARQRKGNGREVCPEACPLHGRSVRHGHVSVRIRSKQDIDDEDKLDEEGKPEEDAWLSRVFLGVLELYGTDVGEGQRSYDFTLRSQKELMKEEYKALASKLRAFKSKGRLASVYLPIRLFGGSPHVGLSFEQRQILLAIHRELTRSKRSDRADKAQVIVGGIRAAGASADGIDHYPGLQKGHRYVCFNGNASRRREHLRGRGYRILGDYGWLMRSRYALLEEGKSPWMEVRAFLKDLEHVAVEFGLLIAGRHRDRNEWSPLDEMRREARTPPGRKWLAGCVLRIYTEEDYLVRWRRWLADRMGFSSIPDRTQEPDAVQSAWSSPVQLSAYLTQANVSREELAKDLKISRSMLSQRMSGRKPWSKGWQERVKAWIEGRERLGSS